MPPRSRKDTNQNKRFKVFKNEQIRARRIMLLDEEGERIGEFYRDDALRKAQESWLDMIQMQYDPQNNTAIAKLMDYGKYQYNKKKEDKKKKQSQKNKWLKELKFSYMIGEHDLEMKIKKAKEFLEEWYTVRLFARLRWREYTHKDKVFERLSILEETFDDIARSQWLKEERGWYAITLLPKRKNNGQQNPLVSEKKNKGIMIKKVQKKESSDNV